MTITLLLIGAPFIVLVGATLWYFLFVALPRWWRARHAQEPPYRVEPFYSKAHVYTLAQFKELLKKYSMDSDNGKSLWACKGGHWIETSTGKPVTADAWAIREGISFNPIFTHIEFVPK